VHSLSSARSPESALPLLVQITKDARTARVDMLALSTAQALARTGSPDFATIGIGTLRELNRKGSDHTRTLPTEFLVELDVGK
jgi:hypothetical protein